MDGFTLFRIRGIDVRLNWSVIVVATLIAWSLAESLLPEFAEGRSTGVYWTAATVTTVGFLATLAAHELGHSLTAHRHGVGVSSITLWLFGGVAVLDAEPADPRSAFRIAAAGPATSLVIGAVCLLAGIGFDGIVRVSLIWLGAMNLLLALFNLLPAFPLDGGRIFQAWDWQRTGDRKEATGRAARAGLNVGAGLIALGVLQVIAIGNLLGGLWMMMIGWFLREAARAEWRHTVVDEPLRAMTADQIMSADPQTVRDDITIENFIAGAFFGGRHAAYPVVDAAGALVGLITLNAVRRVPFAEIGTATVGSVSLPVDAVLRVPPTVSVADLIASMAKDAQSRALVVDGDRLLGIVAPSDVARLVAVVELSLPIGHERELIGD